MATARYQKYQPYRYQRVDRPDFPGPGHISEQGGYWTDQPSVTSNQVNRDCRNHRIQHKHRIYRIHQHVALK